MTPQNQTATEAILEVYTNLIELRERIGTSPQTQEFIEDLNQNLKILGRHLASQGRHPSERENEFHETAKISRIGGKKAPNKTATGLVAIFFGGLGFHKFMLGKSGAGLAYLLFFWTMIPAILGFFEGIVYLLESQENFEKRAK